MNHMSQHRQRIKLTGFRDASVIDAIFASSMVDVAYIDEIVPDAIYVISEDPDNTADFTWLREIISQTLKDQGIEGVTIQIPEQ